VLLEIRTDAVVVEKRVVDVDEKDHGPNGHSDILSQLRHDLRLTESTRGVVVGIRVQWVLTAVVGAVLLAGCGGSDGPETVNGCIIEPSTSCTNADLSGADLSGADLSQATLVAANLEGTNLSDANLTESNLGGAQIVDADLSGADLTRANLTGATVTGTDLDGATLCGTTRTDGTIDDTDCPASTDTTDTTETTETTTSSAEVTAFDVGDLTCGAATTAPVAVTWETQDATAVEIAVDTFPPSGFGANGSTNVVVPCDDESHTITITPQSDSGPGESESEEVSPS
jgi:Pentapeptide repeats (8 copies)